MVKCSVCEEKVPYALLRTPEPKCSKDHVLGRWTKCGSPEGGHIYLRLGEEVKCPICSNQIAEEIMKGTSIKCLHVAPDGGPCAQPRYKWLIDGPPCYLNHLDIAQEDLLKS